MVFVGIDITRIARPSGIRHYRCFSIETVKERFADYAANGKLESFDRVISRRLPFRNVYRAQLMGVI